MSINGKKAVSKRKMVIPPNRLQELRERGKSRGGLWLTATEVAAIRGIDVSLVSLHENHKRPLTDADVIEYAKLYKVREHQIFSGLTIRDSKLTGKTPRS